MANRFFSAMKGYLDKIKVYLNRLNFYVFPENYNFCFPLMNYENYCKLRLTALYHEYNIVIKIDRKEEQNSATKDIMFQGYRELADNIIFKYYYNDKLISKPILMQDIIKLEQCITRLLPDAEMSLRGVIIEYRFHELVGDQLFNQIKSKFTSNNLVTTEEKLSRRTELDYMLQVIGNSYTSAENRDQFRYRILLYSFYTLSLTYAALITLLSLFSFYYNLKLQMADYMTILAVPFMGSLGAFISIQYSKEQLPAKNDVMLTALELNSGLLGLCFRIWSGGIFAILINLLFVANFMNDLFVNPSELNIVIPSTNNKSELIGLENTFIFISGLRGLNSIVIAKILCWSLIAGFAERLLPNRLESIVKRLDSTNNNPAATAPIAAAAAPGNPPKPVGSEVHTKLDIANTPNSSNGSGMNQSNGGIANTPTNGNITVLTSLKSS